MIAINGKNVKLKDGALLSKEWANRDYLMELNPDALLQNFYNEAGLHQHYGSSHMAHTGWEDPTCQLRGHFLGHWLSAAAVRYDETGDEELLAKANAIVHQLKLCQNENGGEWAASIPEKYFTWIARGKQVWAPHYTVHKTFMGLNDMYRYAGNREALEVSCNFAKWFLRYTDDKSREEMDNILDFETGGMLEIWADLYEFTGDSMYLTLIERYDRHRMFDPLLEGVDVLTNMHANTTIPEAIGCIRVYEATGKRRYLDIAMKYFDLAVNRRGTFVTGGQTCGEIWTPMNEMAARLGSKNQEHCTVYNMIRLADRLFCQTGDHSYLDYIEQNLYNGILSQGYFRGGHANGEEATYPEEGLITYFQPLKAGLRKVWAGKFDSFFCCHGTLVQANSAHNRYLYYRDGDEIFTGVYAASEFSFDISGANMILSQFRDTLSGCLQTSSNNDAKQTDNGNNRIYAHQPDRLMNVFRIQTSAASVDFTLNLRLPKWVRSAPSLFVNGEAVPVDPLLQNGFVSLARSWKDGDEVRFCLPLSVYSTPLPGDESMVAFSYGPFALAGLCTAERTLHLHGCEAPEELLIHDNEREWGMWKDTFRSRFQDPGINFVPLNSIGYEPYQVYFPLEKD